MTSTVEAGFLGDTRRAFQVSFIPDGQIRGNVLYLPPFAEEMNRCRAIVAEQARAFRERGYACTLLDWFGTGEAEGRLEDASLAAWTQNISDAAASFDTDRPLTLWGCRLGALLALHHLNNNPDRMCDLLLWQPQSSGKNFVTQLLRQRAAARLERSLPREDKETLRQELRDGATLEVGGYALGGELLDALEALEIERMTPRNLGHVWWLEHQSQDDRPIPPRTQRAMDHLQSHCTHFELHRFDGPQLWQLHERDRCDPLLRATATCLS